jgi:VWFA-related protein
MKFRLVLFHLLIIFVSSNLIAQEDDIIKVDSSLVVLNATITDSNGKPVRNLKQSQFKILEEGKEQTISFFETEETPFAAVILIDSSGSMNQLK